MNINRLSQYALKSQYDHPVFGCDWLPTPTDDTHFLTNKNTDYEILLQTHTVGDMPLVSDRGTLEISPKTNKISLKRHKSSVCIFSGQQNNFSEAKIDCQPKQITHNPSEINNKQVWHHIQEIKRTQLCKNTPTSQRAKDEDKSYNYRSVITPHANTFLPQRLLLRQNSGTNFTPATAIFVPHLIHTNKVSQEPQFIAMKQIRSPNQHSHLFAGSNQQKGHSFLLQQAKGYLNQHMILPPYKSFKKDTQNDSPNSCIKSKLSLQTNIDREPLRQNYSQSSKGKPRTMNHLTHMADVEQILSVLDDSVDLDNKQSIVLGRMTHYSSGGNLLQQLSPTPSHAANPTQISLITRATSLNP